jgi:hypothetical protein
MPAARARGLRGDGLAVLVQGGFLLVLDSVAAQALSTGRSARIDLDIR